MLQLTQPFVDPSTEQNKRRKSGPGKYFPAELPGAAGKDVAGDTEPAMGRLAPTEHRALAIETAAPVAEETPLVLAVEPRLQRGHTIPSDSSKQGNFLKSRKKRKK